MESFHIQSEDYKFSDITFGNMKSFNSGNSVYNIKARGIYFTLFLTAFTAVLIFFLFFITFEHNIQNKIIFSVILSVNTIITILLSIYVSQSNPGFFKPEERDLDKDATIKTLLASVKSNNLFLKYCTTCKIVRDLRVFHCKDCNLCVLRHGTLKLLIINHHCPWLSICIGYRNHKRFIILLFFSIIQCSIIISSSGYLIYLFENLKENNFLEINYKVYYSITIGLLIIVSIAFFLILLVLFFQIKFICSNQTTSENIRLQPKIFDIGFKANIIEFYSDILGYRNRIEYSNSALGYLSTTKKLSEYFEVQERGSLNIQVSDNINKTEENSKKSTEVEKESQLDISHYNSNLSSSNLISAELN